MTVLVGHRDGWLVADRRSTSGSMIGPFEQSKIINLGYALLAGAGDGAALERIYNALAHEANEGNIVGFVSEWLAQSELDANFLLVTRNKQLVMFSADGAIWRLKNKQKFWCLGSGGPYAQGYLTGISLYENDIAIQDAKSAVRYAMTCCAACGDGIQVEKLK